MVDFQIAENLHTCTHAPAHIHKYLPSFNYTIYSQWRCGEGENSSSTLEGLPAGLRIKFTWERLTGENTKVLLCAHGRPVMKLRLKKMTKAGK